MSLKTTLAAAVTKVKNLITQIEGEVSNASKIVLNILETGLVWLESPTAGTLEGIVMAVLPPSAPYIEAVKALVPVFEQQIISAPAGEARVKILYSLLYDIYAYVEYGTTATPAQTVSSIQAVATIAATTVA